MGREQRANERRRAAARKIVDAVTNAAVDDGKLIELGFRSLLAAAYPGWQDKMMQLQYDAIREAYFAGCQHLFASIMGGLDDGTEPTEADLKRMTLIEHELNGFIEEFKIRHGITDPDVGPSKSTEH